MFPGTTGTAGCDLPYHTILYHILIEASDPDPILKLINIFSWGTWLPLAYGSTAVPQCSWETLAQTSSPADKYFVWLPQGYPNIFSPRATYWNAFSMEGHRCVVSVVKHWIMCIWERFTLFLTSLFGLETSVPALSHNEVFDLDVSTMQNY